MAEHKDTENAQSGGQEENFNARRRLLKASAAVPLIGTLSPGAALAATSTQCNMDGNSFEGALAIDDKALRVQAVYWESKNPAKRNDLYEVGGKFYDALDGQMVRPRYKPNSTRPRGYYRGVERYVLCYVDVARDPSTGDVISQEVHVTGFFPQQNTYGTAISDSCLASMGGLQSAISDQANG